MSAFPGGSSRSALGNALSELLEQADLREVLRKAAQIVDLRGSLALPRQIASEPGVSAPLLGPQLVVDLVSPAERPGVAALALPVEQAGALVDRLLGGTGGVGVASQVGGLSDAECGVLAYFAARLCAGSATGLRVADVQCWNAAELLERWPEGFCWSARLSGAEHQFDVCALFAEAASCPEGQVALELVVPDDVAPHELDEARPGDLLASESWPLTATTRGLEGTVEVRVAGCAEVLLARLQGERLVVAGRARTRPRGAELVLVALPVTLVDLAKTCSGKALPVPPRSFEHVELRVEGRAVLAGSLVQYGGSIALQVGEVYSTR